MDKRYQVFLSSTYADLKEERRAVIQTLMEMDCIPAGMELFPAADEEQFSFIKRVVDDCDYYLLIIGGRYGSTTPEGLSYTEKEYDYARERRIPVLAFVHEDPGKIALQKSELDVGMRAKLDSFREKVKTGKMVKMWQDAKDLPGLVALSLSKTIKTHPAVGWVRADKVATTEALYDLNTLRKRNEELEKRLQDLTPSLPDLAGFEDDFEITGTYQFDSDRSSIGWKFTVKWGELFAALGPRILECPNDAMMHTYFDLEVLELYKSRNLRTYKNWAVKSQAFQTVKVQLMALNLARVEMTATTDGGQALFWFPTELGEQTLLQLRTAKKRR
jgi:hypothetical protein